MRVFYLLSLLVAIFFINIGYGMIMSYIGIFLKENNVSNVMIGIVNASFFIGASLSSFFASNLISTVGHIRSFSAFSALLIGTFLLHNLVFNEYVWIILRMISGFSYFAILMIIESWLNEKSDSNSRGNILSSYTIIFYFANAIGQFILSTFISLQKDLFLIASILMIFPIVIIAFTKIKEPNLIAIEKISFPKVYSVVPLALSAGFIAGFLIGGYFTMMPIYILEKFMSIEYIPFTISITILGGLLSQYPIGKLSDKYGRRKIIAISGFITSVSSSLFIIFDVGIIMMYLFCFCLGLTIFAIYPLAIARANDVLDENSDVIEISRVLLLFSGLGSFIAPFIIGFSMEFHSESLFIIFAILGFYLGFYALSKKRIKDDELSIFVNMPLNATPEIQSLDPRTDKEETIINHYHESDKS